MISNLTRTMLVDKRNSNHIIELSSHHKPYWPNIKKKLSLSCLGVILTKLLSKETTQFLTKWSWSSGKKVPDVASVLGLIPFDHPWTP